jgi:hypothetical protein
MIAFASTTVPVPDSVAVLIGSCMPLHVLQAEVAAEVGRFRPLACSEDRVDREQQLAVLAAANKVLAAYNPRLILRPVRAS